MRTPRSTVGSYSKVSCGVLFRSSSRAIRDCRKPCADWRPASVACRFRALPSTDTKTRPSRRSGETSTPVTVTMPTRGSLSSTIASATTARTDSFTRRIRSVIERHHLQGRVPRQDVKIAILMKHRRADRNGGDCNETVGDTAHTFARRATHPREARGRLEVDEAFEPE